MENSVDLFSFITLYLSLSSVLGSEKFRIKCTVTFINKLFIFKYLYICMKQFEGLGPKLHGNIFGIWWAIK